MGDSGRGQMVDEGHHEGRTELGLSQAQLGDITGFGSSPMGRWRDHGVPPSATVARRLEVARAAQVLPPGVDALADRVARLEHDLVALREALRDRSGGPLDAASA
jgi:hypothetical protein